MNNLPKVVAIMGVDKLYLLTSLDYYSELFAMAKHISQDSTPPLNTDLLGIVVSIRDGAVVQRVRHLGLRSVGRGFKSCSRQRCVTTLGKLFTPMCLCHQAV